MDGKEVAQGKIERTIPVRFSLDETMDVGMDTGTPVVEDYADKMPFKFTGEITKVTVELEGELTPTGRPKGKSELKSSQPGDKPQASEVPDGEKARYQALQERLALHD